MPTVTSCGLVTEQGWTHVNLLRTYESPRCCQTARTASECLILDCDFDNSIGYGGREGAVPPTRRATAAIALQSTQMVVDVAVTVLPALMGIVWVGAAATAASSI